MLPLVPLSFREATVAWSGLTTLLATPHCMHDSTTYARTAVWRCANYHVDRGRYENRQQAIVVLPPFLDQWTANASRWMLVQCQPPRGYNIAPLAPNLSSMLCFVGANSGPTRASACVHADEGQCGQLRHRHQSERQTGSLSPFPVASFFAITTTLFTLDTRSPCSQPALQSTVYICKLLR